MSNEKETTDGKNANRIDFDGMPESRFSFHYSPPNMIGKKVKWVIGIDISNKLKNKNNE